MIGFLGASAGPDGRWRVSIHNLTGDAEGQDLIGTEELLSWDEFPAPRLKSFEDGWVELFRVMNPKVKRIYTVLDPDTITQTTISSRRRQIKGLKLPCCTASGNSGKNDMSTLDRSRVDWG